MKLHTFSIVGRCSRTGMLGVAVSTAVPAVGAICPFAKAGVGAIATQSWVNPYLAIDGLALLEQGLDAQTALNRLIEPDPDRELRQIGIIDSSGVSVAYSGSECTEWYGHLIGSNYAVQGNMLVGGETIEAMAEAFEVNEGDDLAERLMKCLEAGQLRGGDKRGRQSAALIVVKTEEYDFVNLRADEHPEPVVELRRIFEIAKSQLIPFVDMMPTRENPEGTLDESIMELLLKSPSRR